MSVFTANQFNSQDGSYGSLLRRSKGQGKLPIPFTIPCGLARPKGTINLPSSKGKAGLYPLLHYKDLKELCLIESEKIKKTNNWETYISDSSERYLANEINILISKLKAWKTFLSSQDILPTIWPIDILLGNLTRGHEYTLELAKSLSYSIKECLAVSNVLTPEDVKTYKLEHIESIFPPRHLIPFMIPEDLDDVEDNSFDKPKFSYTDDEKEKLFDIMVANIKNSRELRYFDDIDSITLMDSKVCMASTNKKEKSFKERIKKKCPTTLASEFRYNISSVTKNPAESRVIPVADIPTRNFNYIMRQNLDLVFNAKYDIYGKDEKLTVKYLDEKPDRFFIQVDQKKSGWTFPQELISLSMKAVRKAIPNFPYIEEFLDIWENNKINYFYKGAWNKPQRGFAIGVWDNIMSFVVACIFELFLENRKDYSEENGNILSGKFWGDDQVIRIDRCSKKQAMSYWNKWIRTLLKFGLDINTKKSFLSERGLLCETYGREFPDTFICNKDCMHALKYYDSLRGTTMFERKVMWAQTYDICATNIATCSMDQEEFLKDYYGKQGSLVMTMIGYEFDSREFNLPLHVGGWLLPRDEDSGLQTFVKEIMDIDVPAPYKRIGYLCSSTLSPSYYSHSVYKEIKDTKFFEDLVSCMSFGSENFGDTLTARTKLMCLDAHSKNRVNHNHALRIQKSRLIAYHSKQIVTHRMLIQSLIANNHFDGMLIDSTFCQKRQECIGFFTEAKNIVTENRRKVCPARACCLMNDFLYNKISSISYVDPVHPGNLGENIYNDISSSKYAIPMEWYIWCRNTKNKFEDVRKYFKNDFKNIFHYSPPFFIKSDCADLIPDLSEGDYVLFDPNLKIPVVLDSDRTDMFQNCSEEFKKDLLKASFTFEEYLHISDLLSVPPFIKDEEEECSPEELELLEKLSHEVSMDRVFGKEVKININLLQLDTLEDLLAQQGSCDSEWETTASSSSGDEYDKLFKEFCGSDEEDIDQMGYGLLDMEGVG